MHDEVCVHPSAREHLACADDVPGLEVAKTGSRASCGLPGCARRVRVGSASPRSRSIARPSRAICSHDASPWQVIPARTGLGPPTLLTSTRAKAGCISRWCSTWPRGAWWVVAAHPDRSGPHPGALRMALTRRGAPAGGLHHSDRGGQYACAAYQQLLEHTGMLPSMKSERRLLG